ncbi:MAG: hypothetical protein ACOCWG_02325 [bacterium]
MKKIPILWMLVIIGISIHAQKPQKEKLANGFLNPVSSIDFTGKGVSSVNYLVDCPATEAEIKANNYKLKIEGAKEGNDYTIVFFIYNAKIHEYIGTSSTGQITSYIPKVSVKAETQAFLLNNKYEIIWNFVTRPDFNYVDYKGSPQGTENLAKAELKKIQPSTKQTVLKKYCKEIFKAYQEKINTELGLGIVNTYYLRLFTLKDKKFNYGDFNELTLKLAGSIQENGSYNMDILDAVIAEYEKWVEKYQPGKNGAICDKNINEIFNNLAIAYWLKGDAENLKKYYDKFMNMEGNRTYESFAKLSMEQALKNNEYKKKYPEPVARQIRPEIIARNYELIFNGFLSNYICNKAGIGHYQPILPENYNMLKSLDRNFYVKHKEAEIKARASATFEIFGKLRTLDVSATSGELNENFGLVVNYDANGNVESVLDKEKNEVLFKFTYAPNLVLQKVTKHEIGAVMRSIYEVKSSDNNEFVFNVTYTLAFKKGDDMDEYVQKIKLDEHNRITGISLRPGIISKMYITELVRDEFGRISQQATIVRDLDGGNEDPLGTLTILREDVDMLMNAGLIDGNKFKEQAYYTYIIPRTKLK